MVRRIPSLIIWTRGTHLFDGGLRCGLPAIVHRLGGMLLLAKFI
jgi:hypothetical protein